MYKRMDREEILNMVHKGCGRVTYGIGKAVEGWISANHLYTAHG